MVSDVDHEGDRLGEFEEFTLLAVCALRAPVYGVPVQQFVEDATGRRVSMGAVYAALSRLEDKGFVRSAMSEPTARARRQAKAAVSRDAARAPHRERAAPRPRKIWNAIESVPVDGHAIPVRRCSRARCCACGRSAIAARRSQPISPSCFGGGRPSAAGGRRARRYYADVRASGGRSRARAVDRVRRRGSWPRLARWLSRRPRRSRLRDAPHPPSAGVRGRRHRLARVRRRRQHARLQRRQRAGAQAAARRAARGAGLRSAAATARRSRFRRIVDIRDRNDTLRRPASRTAWRR